MRKKRRGDRLPGGREPKAATPVKAYCPKCKLECITGFDGRSRCCDKKVEFK